MKKWTLKILLLLAFLSPIIGFSQTFIPEKVPPYSFLRLASPASEGHLFLGVFNLILVSNYQPSNMIVDSDGELLWYYKNFNRKLGFTLQPGGLMSWYENGQYYLMDSTFELVDSLSCTNGRRTDDHELHFGANGNYFVLCTKDTAADLSGVQTTLGAWGSASGVARYAVIQELDGSGNLVKEWDGTPYWQPEDIIPQYFDTWWQMDLNHPNSIDTDSSGQVLLSSRHVSEITCIDWASGQIKWRMGGTYNEFTFANGDPGNNTQHDARFLPGGGISLFDNGTYHQPAISRAIEYDLDTTNRIATLRWAYQHASQISTAMGNYQRLPNGESLICWGIGNITPFDHVSHVNRDSTLDYKLRLAGQFVSYRASLHELPFSVNRPRIVCDENGGVVTLSVEGVHSDFQWSTGDSSATITVSDTDKYQVFVPYGIGWAGSKPLHITDLNAPCLATSVDPVMPRERQLLGTWDLLGRPVDRPVPGQLYLRRYDDGSSEKCIQF